MRDWLDSCTRLKRELPPEVLVLPAHNEPFVGAPERLQALIDGHERSMDRVEKRLREAPRRCVDLFPALFPMHISGDQLGFATGEALAHVHCLIGRGRARRTTSEAGIWLFSAP